jgi:hypothetical protein
MYIIPQFKSIKRKKKGKKDGEGKGKKEGVSKRRKMKKNK